MTAIIRGKMQELMRATIRDEQMHHCWEYFAVRPCYVLAAFVPGKRKKADCSKGCQFIAKWGGAPDPMGRHFDAWGNSTTMTIHMVHLDHPSELEIADYVTFGPNGDDHATAVQERGTDPLLWSDGHQGAPNNYHLSYDRRERHYLRNPVHVAPLTSDDKLRERTGFWAWVQWRKGTGHWRHKGKRNKHVRPNVPKRIPLRWFRRYVKIWGNQRRGNPPTT